MNERGSREEIPEFRIKLLRCRRTNQLLSPAEHTDCRYCFGTEEEIEHGGSYTKFCDYRPGVDPEGAAHPSELSRYSSG